MNGIRICVYDNDKEYARRLATMISRYGEGNYKVSAFDNKEDLLSQVQKKVFQIFIGDSFEFEGMLQNVTEYVIHLVENEIDYTDVSQRKGKRITVSKYAGARVISRQVECFAMELCAYKKKGNQLIAIYSPVGRCGKTQFALSLGKEEYGRKWLYIGFEDYGVIGNSEKEISDSLWETSFLYYVKERNTEGVNQVIENGRGILLSSFSPMDGKQLTEEDFIWMVQTIREQQYYSGIVFDIGTGVLQSLEWLDLFDDIFVPYIPNDMALLKKDKFNQVLRASELEYVMEKIIYLNMSKQEDIDEQRMRLINETGTRISSESA